MLRFFKKRRDSIHDSRFAVGLQKVPLKTDTVKAAPVSDHRKFVCPACGNKALTIQRNIELGSDARDDEFSLQAVSCSECAFVGVATYQESRRGAEESWDHLCYRMEAADFEPFLEMLTKCNAATDSKCSCEAHSHFGRRDERVRLRPLDKLEHDKNHRAMRFG